MNSYDIVENYRDDTSLRNKFFSFTETVFSWADFRIWFQRGHWSDNYVPISVLADEVIVANVSISKMKILHNGQCIKGLQFGTVGTLPTFQGKGLSRRLMEYAMSKYGDSADLLLLFANDTVLDFYPRFGFSRQSETLYFSGQVSHNPSSSARKLDIHNEGDASLVEGCIARRLPLTNLFGAKDYGFITWWHMLNLYSDSLYYVEDEEVIFIMTLENKRLHVWDVIFAKQFDFQKALEKVMPVEQVDSICYHFPSDQLGFKFDHTEPDAESHLFVRGSFAPEDGIFKFPPTAET